MEIREKDERSAPIKVGIAWYCISLPSVVMTRDDREVIWFLDDTVMVV